MKNLIKKIFIALFVLFSTCLHAEIIEYSQNTENGVYAGVKTYLYDPADQHYNHLMYTPLTNEGPDVVQIFSQTQDARVANQYTLNLLKEADLNTISCYATSGDQYCTEVLDWSYVFTHSSGATIEGYYDNYKEGNITMDWDTLLKAQDDALTSAVNFSSGDNLRFQDFTNGVWEAKTYLEGQTFSSMQICVGNNCDLELLNSVTFDTVEADEYVIEADLFSSDPILDSEPAFSAGAKAVPEPGSIALFALGFLLLGRRLIT